MFAPAVSLLSNYTNKHMIVRRTLTVSVFLVYIKQLKWSVKRLVKAVGQAVGQTVGQTVGQVVG